MNTSSSSVRFSTMLLTLMLAGFMAAWSADRAEASQVQPVSIEACVDNGFGGCGPTGTVRVDQAFGLSVEFRVTSTLFSGQAINVRAPIGTVFRNSVKNHTTLSVGDTGHAVPAGNVQIIEEGRTLAVTVPTDAQPPIGSIPSTTDLGLNIGYFNDDIQVPPVPGTFGVEVWTTTDSDGRTSDDALTTTPGLPGALELIGDESTARVTTDFTGPIGAKVTDSRGNGLAGQTVTFSLPGEESEAGGGSFPGEETTFTDTTNGLGVVTVPTITAGEAAGAWGLGVDGPGNLDGTIVLNNTPGAAFEIEIGIEPELLPADGVATAVAEIGVADEFGNAITDHELTIDTGGGPAATEPVPAPGGVYTSQLTASTTPGIYLITVTDTTAIPDLTGDTELEQIVPPPTGLTIELSPASIPADGVTHTTATVQVVSSSSSPIPELELEIESDGEQVIDTPVAGANNTYTAKILSTTVPGVATITATAVVGELEFSASAGLSQTAPDPGPGPGPKVKPVVRIKSGPRGKTSRGKVKFRFAVTKGKARGFQCRLDRKKWKRCRSPKTVRVKPGRHVFRVRAIGVDGKPGKAAKRSFKRIR